MNPLLTTVVIFVTLSAALLAGFRLRVLLPEQHLTAESKDAIKVAMGLVATMTALLLGLLVGSAKDRYDTERNEVIQMAAKLEFLDRLLMVYGPDATPARSALRSVTGDAIRRMWPSESGAVSDVAPDERGGNAVFLTVEALTPRDDAHGQLKSQARTLISELGEIRTMIVAQSTPSISFPLLVTVVGWLVVLFVSFAMLAPANTTTVVALFAAALSVVGAFFLILELDQPFDGTIRIPSAPMVAVLSHMAK